MKYAIVNGERRQAEPGIVGVCVVCASTTVAKCGALRVRHWAHRSRRSCDRWWETETAWHRAWKDAFPAAWQEVVQRAPNGELHIADVKTGAGTVLEFQHSPLNPIERRAREAFYGDMVWIVDGTRRRRDRRQFLDALQKRCADPAIFTVWRDETALARDWAGSPVPVYFDLGANAADDEAMLWRLLPGGGHAYVTPVERSAFIAGHRGGDTSEATRTALARGVLEALQRPTASLQPLPGFARHLARQQRQRRRF